MNSGHNPLVPGPDDLINSDNLTDQLSQLAVAGLYTGALNPDDDNYVQTLNDITSSVADSGTYLFNKTIDPSALTVVDNSTQANTAYVRVSAPLLQQFSNTLGNEFAQIKNNLNAIGKGGFSDPVKKFFAQQAIIYDDISKTGLALPVPRTFADIHADFLSLTQQMSAVSTAIANGDTDSVKAALARDALGNMYTKYINFLTAYSDTLQTIHIDINSLDNLLPWNDALFQ